MQAGNASTCPHFLFDEDSRERKTLRQPGDIAYLQIPEINILSQYISVVRELNALEQLGRADAPLLKGDLQPLWAADVYAGGRTEGCLEEGANQ